MFIIGPWEVRDSQELDRTSDVTKTDSLDRIARLVTDLLANAGLLTGHIAEAHDGRRAALDADRGFRSNFGR